MRFGRQQPSPRTLRWVEQALGGAARVVAWRRLTGGITSSVHRLTIDHGTFRNVLVLRQYEHSSSGNARLIEHEAATLRAVRNSGVAAPELVGADVRGDETDGHPTLLMSRVPGHVDLAPADPDSWLRQIAGAAVRIHHAPVAAPPVMRWADSANLAVPASATRQAL